MKLSRLRALAIILFSAALPLHADTFLAQGKAPRDDGDISWNLEILDTPDETACAYLFFERRDAQNYRALKLTDGAIFLVKVERSVESFLGTGVSFEPVPGNSYVVTVRRRASTLSVVLDGARLFGVSDAPDPQPGFYGYQVSPEDDTGWIRISAASWVSAPLVRLDRSFKLEDRSASKSLQPGLSSNLGLGTNAIPEEWEVVSGAWYLKPMPSQNSRSPGWVPSASEVLSPLPRYTGRAGLVLIGDKNWDSYTARVAVQLGGPAEGGALRANAVAGLVFYAVSPEQYYLLRLVGTRSEPNESGSSSHLRLELVKVMEGEEFVLQRRSTSLAPRQWYELTVAVVEDAIKAYVDGQFAFVAYDDELVGGRVGLCAQGLYASRFDDLVVRSLRVDQGDFLEDRDGPAAELQPAEQSSPAQPPAKCGAWRKQDSPEGLLFESSSDFYGNVALEWEPHGPLVAGGSATLTICAEEADPDSGYSLTVLQEDNGSAGLCLARNGRTLRTVRAGLSKPEGESTAAPKSDPNNPFRFCLDKSGTLITASFNDEPIIEFSDPEPLAGPRLRFKTDLPLADAPQDLRVSSENERTELFAQAPVDWLMSAGDWEVYPPDRGFSSHPWLGNLEATVSRTSGRGASDRVGSAIVWHKGACAGDLALEYDVATPDATPQGPFPYNFNAALCADGRDLSSGYCVMFSPPGQTGEFEWPIRLIRKGKVVLETRRMLDEALSPSGDERERLTPVAGGWRLRIQKRGEFLRFFVNDRLAIEYRDRKPLNGSRWGLWTLGAPMAVSRVRIAWSQSADSLSVFASEEGHGATEPEGDMGTRSPRSLPSSHDAVAAFDPAESAVKVTNARCGGTFDFPLIAAPLKVSLSSQPTPDFLSFDFKCEPDVAINLYLKVGGRLYAIPLTGAHEHRRDVKVLPGIRLPGRSEAWQEVRLDLATLLARFLPGAQEAVIDDLWLGNASTNWRLAAGLSANRIDSAYWLRRITTSHQ